jgi:hypothetical protein
MREKHFLTFLSYKTSVVLPGYMSLVSTLHALWQHERSSLSAANYEKIKRALLPDCALIPSLPLYMYFLRFSKQTAIISLKSTDLFTFLMET